MQPILDIDARDVLPSVTLEEVAQGIVTSASLGPDYFHIEARAESLGAEAALIHRRFMGLTGHPHADAVVRLAHACNSERISPHEIVFMDIETTGLSATPVFLIGTMECGQDGFVFKQYFARNFEEETSILAAFAERLKTTRLMITFNGKSFDMPFLINRGVANRMKMPMPEFHLDLLHEARRVYSEELPNCKLQTLEYYICGRSRDDDIPGAEIPAAYKAFVRTGNANKIGTILMHNLYDILTMADLMNRMWGRD
ncbi:MAG: ribonuclease H-like domain-containing protein [Armatimonadetes bacterium]|nr:ribonuclease H-like domain-containing protein [Armatimonadota bacterium]